MLVMNSDYSQTNKLYLYEIKLFFRNISLIFTLNTGMYIHSFWHCVIYLAQPHLLEPTLQISCF